MSWQSRQFARRAFTRGIVALAILGGLAWWQQGRVRYYLGLTESGEAVRTAIRNVTEAVAAGDFDRLFNLMSSEYQQRALTDVDRMKSVLVSGTEANKKEVRERLQKLGISEETVLKEDRRKVASLLVKDDVAANPVKFPKTGSDVSEISIVRDQARVTVKSGEGRESTIEFVKEGGAWRFKF